MRRGASIAVPLVIVLLAGLAAPNYAAGRSGSRSERNHRYRTHQLSFAYPAAWRQLHCTQVQGTGADTIVFLSSASPPPSCTEWGWPHQRLRRGGVIVLWWSSYLASSIRQFPGRRIRVNGQPARIAVQPPSAGAFLGSCSKVGATRTMNVAIRFPQAARSWYRMTACLRGPGLSRREAQIRRMIASVKLKAIRLELRVCGARLAQVGAIVPDHGRGKVRWRPRTGSTLVSVRLQEPSKYLAGGYPQAFPWRMPISSNPQLLDPISLCHPRGKPNVRIATFRSPSSGVTGRVHLRAALAPAWRALPPSARDGVAPYRSTVIVTGKSQRRASSKR